MPGVNRTGLPTTENLFLGRGSLQYAPLDTVTGKPTHFRHLGNVTALTAGVETEVLQHFNTRGGIKVIDREIVLSQAINIGFTLDHATDFDNLAMFLSGTATKDNTNAANATVTDKLIHADGQLGREYELRNASEARLFDIVAGNLVVKQHATTLGSATNLTQGTDYTVDAIWGTIHILSTGAFVAGNNLWFTYTTATTEKLVDVVSMLTTSKLSGFLRFKGINPANNDEQILIDFHSVSVKADGEMSLIGEEFTELTFTGVAEKNELGYPLAPVGQVFFHTDA